MVGIRPFRLGDEPALSRICLLTGDGGTDATGVVDDDDLWGEIFVLPYAARHPELAFVVEGDDGVPIGYVVGTPDTRAFEEWFRTQWWPRFAERWPEPPVDVPEESLTRQQGLLRYAYGRKPGGEPYGDEHPAHLHIDLLPEAQGQGWGRKLIATLTDSLRAQGVDRLHLVAGAGNTGALAFYTRLGFTPLPSHPGAQAFSLQL
jgi:ribosomal protein S18 acetylase RimI-like enzyme